MPAAHKREAQSLDAKHNNTRWSVGENMSTPIQQYQPSRSVAVIRQLPEETTALATQAGLR